MERSPNETGVTRASRFVVGMDRDGRPRYRRRPQLRLVTARPLALIVPPIVPRWWSPAAALALHSKAQGMPEVHIRITASGTSIEYVGSRAFFERAIAPLVDALAGGPGEAGVAPRAEPPAGPIWKPAAPQRFVRFTAQVGARAETVEQRIMAFAFYLWNYEKEEGCTADQVEAFFRTVREEPPADLQERLDGLCRAKRFLERVDGAGAGHAWRLTTKGVNYVKNRLLVAAD